VVIVDRLVFSQEEAYMNDNVRKRNTTTTIKPTSKAIYLLDCNNDRKRFYIISRPSRTNSQEIEIAPDVVK
jgi:hypothetical protein